MNLVWFVPIRLLRQRQTPNSAGRANGAVEGDVFAGGVGPHVGDGGAVDEGGGIACGVVFLFDAKNVGSGGAQQGALIGVPSKRKDRLALTSNEGYFARDDVVEVDFVPVAGG